MQNTIKSSILVHTDCTPSEQFLHAVGITKASNPSTSTLTSNILRLMAAYMADTALNLIPGYRFISRVFTDAKISRNTLSHCPSIFVP